MPAWISVIWFDLKNAWYSLEPVDFATPSFVGLWILILLLPLIGIDRRDPIAGAVYMLFLTGAGVALVFALPQKFTSSGGSNIQLATVFVMAAVSGFRWFNGANPNVLEDQRKQMELKEKLRKEKNGRQTR